jgi:phenylacetate-coenzyme A ligase PaaK-like adenylate-forming protein
MIDYAHILKNGVEISSSGTTGEPKMVLRTPNNLQACIDVLLMHNSLYEALRCLQ